MAVDLRFEKPGALQVTYRRPREGPNNFLIWMPNWSGIALTRKELLKKVNWSKSTQTGAALRTWLDAIEAQEAPSPGGKADAAVGLSEKRQNGSSGMQINTESWGPEAHEDEPNDQTKMVM